MNKLFLSILFICFATQVVVSQNKCGIYTGGSVDRWKLTPAIILGSGQLTGEVKKLKSTVNFGGSLNLKMGKRLYLVGGAIANFTSGHMRMNDVDSLGKPYIARVNLIGSLKGGIGVNLFEVQDDRLSFQALFHSSTMTTNTVAYSYELGMEYKHLFGKYMYGVELNYQSLPFKSQYDSNLTGGLISLNFNWYFSPTIIFGIW